MGRLILLIFVIVVIVLLWKAFGPGSRGGNWRQLSSSQPQPRPIAPDDDPDFLWQLEKAEINRRKQEQQRRAREQQAQREHNATPDNTTPNTPNAPGGSAKEAPGAPDTPDDPQDTTD